MYTSRESNPEAVYALFRGLSMGNFNVTITSLMYHMHHERFELSPPKRLRLECSALDRSANDAGAFNEVSYAMCEKIDRI